jgi:hypothetical protein
MIDREKVMAVLQKRFPAARSIDLAAAANAIVGLSPEFDALPAEQMRRFDCETRTAHYTTRDVANGDVRLYRRTEEGKRLRE